MKTWLTVAEGAEYSGVSRDTIYTACERRELKHARVGGRRAIRLKPEWIDAWLEQHMRDGLHPARNDGSAPVRTAEASAYPVTNVERGRRKDGAAPPSTRAMTRSQRGYSDGC